MQQAQRQLEQLRDLLRFDRMTLCTRDWGRPWQVRYAGRLLLNYWPTVAKAQLRGEPRPRICRSLAAVLRLAILAKQRLGDTASP